MRSFIAWLCLAALTARADGVLVDRVVAVVDTFPITRSALLERVRLVQALSRQRRDEAQVRAEALDELIDEHLIAQDARQARLEASEEEVDLALRQVAAENRLTLDQLAAETRAQGLEWAAYRATLRRKILEVKWLSLRVDRQAMARAPSAGDFMLAERRRLVAGLRAAAAVEVRP